VTSNQWTYASAQIAEDDLNGEIHIEVAQLSDQFGPGPYQRVDVEI
jgi:hypothetical protein